MKGKDLLIITGVGVLGYMLAPKAVKDQLQASMPSMPSIGIDFGGLSNLLDPVIPERDFPPYPEDWIPDIPEDWIPDIPEDWIPDIPEDWEREDKSWIQDLIDKLTGNGNTGGDDTTETTPPPAVAPTPPNPTPNPWELFTELHPIVQNVVMGTAGLGGVYGAVRGVQVIAPATKTVFSGLAETFNRFLRGGNKTPGTPPTNIFKTPKGVNPKLWAQWLKRTPLSKGLLRGVGGGIAGLGLVPLGLMDIINELDFSQGWYNPIWEDNTNSESDYSPREITTRPESDYSPREITITPEETRVADLIYQPSPNIPIVPPTRKLYEQPEQTQAYIADF